MCPRTQEQMESLIQKKYFLSSILKYQFKIKCFRPNKKKCTEMVGTIVFNYLFELLYNLLSSIVHSLFSNLNINWGILWISSSTQEKSIQLIL